MGTLNKLLSPISTVDFFKDFWRKAPLFITEQHDFDEILTLQEIERYFSGPSLLYPYVRVVGNGNEVELAKYQIINNGSFVVLNKINLFNLLAEGNSLIIQAAQFQFPSLQSFVRELESELGFEINANVYITPRNARGFNPHYDTHEVLVLQIYGRKNWNIYHEIPFEAPIKGELTQQQREHYLSTELVHRVELSAGNVLYIPRGVVHDAFCDTDVSIHVTLGLHPTLRLDLVKELVQRLEARTFFREPFWTPGSNNNHADEFIEMLANIKDELDIMQKSIKSYDNYKRKYAESERMFSQTILSS